MLRPEDSENAREELTWKGSWNHSPGPASLKETSILAFKGFCMGTADIIPGVSGGTIAFIMGIYYQLLDAIASFDTFFVNRAFKLQIKEALAHVHLRFLVPLVLGIGVAVLSTARLMHYLLENHPEPTWSLFFGLIGASIFIVGKKIRDWRSGWFFLAAGAVGAFFLVGMIPRKTPDTWWFVFLSGSIAICAMILPGISGSFILLLLGKYMYVTGALKDPLDLSNFKTLCIFGSGALVGIVFFSRLLKYLLERHNNAAMALLTGFMAGAMRKIWPWQRVETVSLPGMKTTVTSNVLPAAMDRGLLLDLALIAAGFAVVLVMDYYSSKKEIAAENKGRPS